MTEVEWKLALDPGEYRRLVAAVKAPKGRHTGNLYWETDDHSLRRRHCGLRLRQSPGGSALLTFKFPEKTARVGRGVHRRGEVECRVSHLTARRLRQGKVSPLDLRNRVAARARDFLGRIQLRPLGELRIERRKARWRDFVLEIDRFSVHGSTYYEVEIEHPDPARVRACLRPFLRANGVRWRPKAATKVSYLYARRAVGTSRRRSAHGKR